MGRGEEDYARSHRSRIDQFAYLVYQAYLQAANRAMVLGRNTKHNAKNKPFSFDLYPQVRKELNKVLATLATNVTGIVQRGITEEWMLAEQKNDDLVKRLFTSSMPVELNRRFLGRNLEALRTFQSQKIDGLGLSEKIWNYTGEFKSELEMAIDMGLLEGRSASQMATDIKHYLNDPDKLFRRVRDARGILHLSKAAANYHPGQGKYRSSYKNSLRLTRTVINDAYRESDHNRWQQLPFVVGIEVKRSNNPYPCPTCDALKGRYPKDYKFRSVHPSCRCYAVSILATKEERERLFEMILNGEDISTFRSVNEVKTMPAGWVKYIRDSRTKLLQRKSVPYFIKDNFKDGKLTNGLRPELAALSESRAGQVPLGIRDYEKKLGIRVDKTIFGYLRAYEVSFNMENATSAHYNVDNRSVTIPIDRRRRNSKWRARTTVYHEYGHALDFMYDLRKHKDVRALMDKYRSKYAKDKDKLYKKLEKSVDKIGWGAAYKENYDRVEQANAFADTLKSLNIKYGGGHSDSYFMRPWMAETEFLAHAFENTFGGNKVFKRLAKDLYEDSIKLVNSLLAELAQSH